VAACRLTLLGGFSLTAANGATLALPTRKDKLLLAYLALSAGRPQSRERLAGLLWGDRGEVQARDSLKQSLAGIRQAFRQAGLDPLHADRESVTFDSTDIEVDAVDFARLSTDPRTLGKAIALYRGDLLDDIGGATAELEDWLRPERQRLGNLAAHVVERCALESVANAVDDETCRVGRLLLTGDRLREPVYRALMRLHVRRGERTAALQWYAACRTALSEELGAAPDAKTDQLYHDILADRAAAPTPRPIEGSAPERPAIAILPFSNLSDDARLGYLCDGITEDVITGLGRFRLFFVIDRHSSAAVSEQESDVAEIGRILGVRYLVQGSVRPHGERVRITVRLLDAVSRTQLWGESYDEALSDALAVPDKVTGAIVATLHSRVEDSVLEQARRKPTLAAYECVVRGIRHLRGYGPDDNERAIDLFQQAMDLDPGYALAIAYRAFAEVVVHGYADAPDDVLARAQTLASTAIELDDLDGRCHWILGMILGYRGNLDGEQYHYQRAIALNPNDANVIASSGLSLAALGRPDEGVGRIREAMRLNPCHPEWYWGDLGIVLYAARRYAEAAEAFGRRRQTGPWLLSRLAACYAQMGRPDDAAAATAETLRMRPDFSLANFRLVRWGPAEAAHILEGMRKAGLPE
jgi:TolB-like protein/DNA-binding SARP family transcriptional activator/Flp pilus assembly protein TadD